MNIRINNREIAVLDGETVIETMRRAGFDVPSLCYAKDAKHRSSCMVCAVKNCETEQMMPSCTTLPVEGMSIDSECDGVQLTRTLSLELLLSDHRADCEAPCRMACPAGMDVAAMNRLYDRKKYDEALALLRDTLVIPATLCYICHAPCEKICRRGDLDRAVAIREIKKELVARTDLETVDAPASNGRKVAVTGSGPASLSAACHLRRQGFDVTVFEPSDAVLTPYLPAGAVPEDVVSLEIEAIRRTGVRFVCNAGNIRPEDFERVVTLQTRSKQPARMIAEGLAAVSEKAVRPFNSTFPRFSEAEKKTVAVQGEKSGCLYCDCEKKGDCRLRRFASEYQIKGSRYLKGSVSEALRRQEIGNGLRFEPAKCIRCGLCVYNSDNGFTFKGRGFMMQVVLPEENRGNVPDMLADLCPTGAIYRNE
ncbi:MAG: (2Fe-2S)-binding protein [Tannerella sp.]|nr:(2Fe-2S)-binding protein [Tannerella sp.]